MQLSGIIAIINRRCFWIFTSAKIFLPAVISIYQFFMASVMKFITLSDILYIFRYLIVQVFMTISYSFCCWSMPWLNFSVLFCSLWGCAEQCTVSYLFLLFTCDILSVLPATVYSIQASCRSPLRAVWFGLFSS